MSVSRDPIEHKPKVRNRIGLDLFLYIALGTALFLGINYEIWWAIWSIGYPLLTITYSCLILSTLGQCIYDVYQRRFSTTSYVLMGVWGLCIAAVILADLYVSLAAT